MLIGATALGLERTGRRRKNVSHLVPSHTDARRDDWFTNDWLTHQSHERWFGSFVTYECQTLVILLEQYFWFVSNRFQQARSSASCGFCMWSQFIPKKRQRKFELLIFTNQFYRHKHSNQFMGNCSSSSKPSKMSAESENFIKNETLKHQVRPALIVLAIECSIVQYVMIRTRTDMVPFFFICRLLFLARHIAATARQSRKSFRNRNSQVPPWRFMNWIACPMEIWFNKPWQPWQVKEPSPACGSKAITSAVTTTPNRRTDLVVCSVC